MDEKKFRDLKVLNQLSLNTAESEIIELNFNKLAVFESCLAEYDLKDTAPMVHNVDLNNILRDDVRIKNFTRDELQKDAPEKMDGYWQVPRLVE